MVGVASSTPSGRLRKMRSPPCARDIACDAQAEPAYAGVLIVGLQAFQQRHGVHALQRFLGASVAHEIPRVGSHGLHLARSASSCITGS